MRSRSWAHPRSRGDHSLPVEVAAANGGSSPLARGPRVCAEERQNKSGLIPARAGTTPSASIISCPSWAHPRSRGDHPPKPSASSSPRGSSPLARGPPSLNKGGGKSNGLIPARAGTTILTGFTSAGAGAHPRSRGDHVWGKVSGLFPLGSSPLARGPPYFLLLVKLAAGLIPARAGTTSAST